MKKFLTILLVTLSFAILAKDVCGCPALNHDGHIETDAVETCVVAKLNTNKVSLEQAQAECVSENS